MQIYQLIAQNVLNRWPLGVALAAALLALNAQAQVTEQPLPAQAKQLFAPLPANMGTVEFPIDTARVALGKKLFFDPRLSLDGSISCASCHLPELYGTDGLPKSFGFAHRLNARNAPTVFNAALQFKAHWLGDRANVEEQAMKSLTGPASFGNPDAAAVLRKINGLPGYAAAFKLAFPNDPEPVKPENWGIAIGAYERTLVTPSAFDAYLHGDTQALTAQAQQGLKTFIDIGCAACHNGVAVGGAMFQKFGIFKDYWLETGSQAIDAGRFNETKVPADKYLFKVPSLRNVAMTSPYFHDGSVQTLPQAVRIMAKLQLNKELTDQETQDLLAFLNSLTGKIPSDFAIATKQ